MALPPAKSLDGALEQLSTTLNEVENEYSGIPYNPDEPEGDGRLYPPSQKYGRPFPQHPRVQRLRQVGHNTLIGDNGSVEIRAVAEDPLEGDLLFSKPGADGKKVMEQ